MITIAAGLNILTEPTIPEYLPVDWHWRRGSGLYVVLVKSEHLDREREPTWDLNSGDSLIGFSSYRDGEEWVNQYSYRPAHADSWPLIVHRNFDGLREPYIEVLEEFRLYHNLDYDSSSQTHFRILSNGQRERVVWNDANGCTFVDLPSLRQYCAARGLTIVLQLDIVEYFKVEQEERSESVNEPGHLYEIHWSNKRISEDPSWGRLLGKRFISPLPKEKCGLWPFDEEKTYRSFIIGRDEAGKPTSATCDPRALERCEISGVSYFTPVYFRKEVLRRYLDQPSIYAVGDGGLSCASIWHVRIDNDLDDHVVVLLGDLGQYLPEEERDHWASYNVPPQGGVSETYWERNFQCNPMDPKSLDLTIHACRSELNRTWQRQFGFELLLDLHNLDRPMLPFVRVPFTNEWSEFDQCLGAVTKVYIDSLNESELTKVTAPEIARYRQDKGEAPRGIAKLEIWLKKHGADQALVDQAVLLRRIQRLRSNSSAHRKGGGFDKALAELGIDHGQPRRGFREQILEPLAALLRELETLAASGTDESESMST
jgi:hypothetical protein